MNNDSTTMPVPQSEAATALRLLDDWFDPIEAALRDQVRSFIQAMIEAELELVLARPRYGRQSKTAPETADRPEKIIGHRHGHRLRSLMGTFGRVEIAMPRARLNTTEGRTTEWKRTALRAYQRRTREADSLIAGAYLAGTNSRRVSSGAGRRLWWRGRQRHGEPGVVAKGQSRLGCLEWALAG